MKKLTPLASRLTEEILRSVEDPLFNDKAAVTRIANMIACVRGEKGCDQGIAAGIMFNELSCIGKKDISPEQIKDFLINDNSELLLRAADTILTFQGFHARWLELFAKQEIFERE